MAKNLYSSRVNRVPKSFVREILKVTEKPEIISFAGGLPNPNFFPVDDIMQATNKVLSSEGEKVLQYSTTEGYVPLREYIANRYYSDCGITADNIVITNGSQQALDLIAKVFLDVRDNVMLERPGYLGAIQSFSMYEPDFVTVGIQDDGVDLHEFEKKINEFKPKLFYAVTNYHNPTGISYSNQNRTALSEIIRTSNTIMIDDNPYGELTFYDRPHVTMKKLLGAQCISLGSFSKIFAPAMRLGWVCADKEIIDKIITMKQASY
jgi:2-aminoadipate transaminase